MRYFLIFLLSGILLSCNRNPHTEVSNNPIAISDSSNMENYFPVTVYFKGQIHDIIEKGINPLKIEYLPNGKADSTWLEVESLNAAFSDFLNPPIDTANMKPWFEESKFLDNTIESYTWTYDARPNIPDSINLRNWTVYVSPSTGKVTSVYMNKALSQNRQLQLTWYADSCTNAITVGEENGKAVIKNKKTILWDFNP